MALTRSFLNGMGLAPEQVAAIIEAHTDTVEALKTQRDEYKESADKAAEIQKQLDEANAKLNDNNSNAEWESKYNELQSTFDAYKEEQTKARELEIKTNSYIKALKDSGVSEKAIDLIIDGSKAKETIEGLEIAEDGTIKGIEELTTAIKTDYAGFITSSETHGANTDTPPGTDANGGISKEQFAKMGYTERTKLFNENRELYDSLSKGE